MKLKLRRFLCIFKLQLGCIVFVTINLLMSSYMVLFFLYWSTEDSYETNRAASITIYVCCGIGIIAAHMMLFGTGAKKIRMLMTGCVILNVEKFIDTLVSWLCLHSDFTTLLIVWTVIEIVVFVYFDIVVVSFWKRTVYGSDDDEEVDYF